MSSPHAFRPALANFPNSCYTKTNPNSCAQTQSISHPNSWHQTSLIRELTITLMPAKSTAKKIKQNRQFNLFWEYRNRPPDNTAESCPYCARREVVKRGRRQKKFESVQLYRCKTCSKNFTAQIVKGKHYPLKVILDGVSLYNLGYSRSQVCQLLKEKYGPPVKPTTLTKWISELAPLCRYRADFAIKPKSSTAQTRSLNQLPWTTSRFTITATTRAISNPLNKQYDLLALWKVSVNGWCVLSILRNCYILFILPFYWVF